MNRRGFTLVEVVIGAAVLLVGFVPIYLFIFGSERSGVETVRTVEALALASGLIDEVAAIPAAVLTAAGPGRYSDEDFASRLPREYGALIDPPSGELAARYERTVELVAGRSGGVRVRVVARPRAPGGSGRAVDEVRLETLVID